MPQFRKPERSAIVAAVRTIGLALATTVSAAETPAEAQERLIWEHALRADRDLGSPWGYDDYLKFHPDGKHADEARRRLREQVWRGRPDIMPVPPRYRYRAT
jgi:hypothetical protein